MNKKSKKNFVKFATVAVATATAFGCFAAGCRERQPNSSGLVPDEDEVATSTSIVNKTPVSEATIYYIGTPAEGVTGDGKTAQTPYSVDAFNEAVIQGDGLKPGDIVRVLPGEHMVTNRIMLNPDKNGGTYDDYLIWEAADPTQKTVLNFKKQLFDSLNRGVSINCDYVYWSNIDICGAGDNGMYIGGSYNVIESCEFYNNRDTGLQIGRSASDLGLLSQWPSYNLIKNCTSYNNYDNETYGENADGFAAKLTVGYGNIFDGCIAYRNSDDGWDLFGKPESGNIGRVLLYNCVAFENGFIMQTQQEYNDWFGDSFNVNVDLGPEFDVREDNTNQFTTRDGDGNGFKLGGSTMAGDVYLENCLSFNNRMHGVTDNSNPGIIKVKGVTSYNNSAGVDTRSHLDIIDENGKHSPVFRDADNKEVIMYHSIASNGLIFNPSGKAVIVNSETKMADIKYANLEEGTNYILDSDSKYVLDEDGQPLQGEHIYAATSGQTVNEAFGHLSGGHSDKCNNIDVARTEGSYNTLSHVLSVNGNDGRSLGEDRYKGAVDYSLFALNITESVKVAESKDTYYLSATQDQLDEGYVSTIMGEKIDAPTVTDIFTALPANDFGLSTTIHSTYRNSDGSVNMGDILKIKDYSKLLGEEHKIGSDLTKTRWEDYPHYDYVYLTDDTVTSRNDALLTAVQDMLYVPVDQNACYQDFSVITNMNNCSISWESSNPGVLSIGTTESETSSGSRSVRVVVNRVKGSETKVTLTALIVSPDMTQAKKKSFVINVKPYDGRLGDIILEDATEDGYVIRYLNEGDEPSFKIANASDYNGKLLDDSDYEVINTEIYHAESKNDEKKQINRFSIGRAGVYEITQTLKIGNLTRDYTYTVYVVSRDGDINFVNGGTVSATYNGYNISGELSNVAGTLYTMVSDTKPTEEQLKAEGEAYQITKDNINVTFEHDISNGFTVYYGIFNPNGTLKSEIYEQAIEIVDITTEDEFKALSQSGGDPTKIYHLTTDLTFTASEGWTVGTTGFKSVLDGMGHTVSGITVRNSTDKGKASVFYRLEGGSIMNIKFENITMEGSQDVGIIGQAYGGYLANIRMKNIRSTGVQRIGGLVGHAYESTVPLIIDNVSLINTNSEAGIYGTTSRAGGIVGFIQTNSTDSLKSRVVDVRISNCYVNAIIGNAAAQQFGGIVGTYDTSTQAALVSYKLTIDSCVFVGKVYSKSRAGGIIGYQQGDGTLRIDNCVSYGDIYHAGSVTPIVVAEKNASGIFGGYVTTADTLVTACHAKFEEHNVNYDVSIVTEGNMTNAAFWRVFTKFDLVDTWELVSGNDAETPYIRLR